MKKVKRIKRQIPDSFVSEDMIIAEETITPNARYVGVVAEKNNSMPHIIVFLEKPIHELSEEEENELVHKCTKVYPEIANIKKREKKAQIDAEGYLLNAKEWDEAPCIGIFPFM